MRANRFFNNSGPVNLEDHFCVAPIKRLDTKKVWQLILQKKYFLICGPKQCGKTSYLLALAQLINRSGNAKCLYFNVESLRGVQEDLVESMRSVLFEISSRARDTFGDDYLEELVSGILERRGPYQALNELLTQWCKRSDKPVVLLVDEIDTLQGTVITSILSQIRAGYDKRPALFPQSIVFCSTHDVIGKQFNIKDASLQVGFLRREEMDEMLGGYAAKRGLEIDRAALDRIWQYSAGQPWIVSTIAAETFEEIATAKGIGLIDAEQVDEAFDNVIVKKGNHQDYLMSQLFDERVKKCLIPILTGAPIEEAIGEEDYAFVQELGVLRNDGTLEISNVFYKEIIPRSLFAPIAYMVNLDGKDYLKPDQSLDGPRLMRFFQSFYRNHVQRLVALLDYGMAGYVLVFQALLQKLADANDFITRDYGIGRGKVALRLRRSHPSRQDIVFILKLARLDSLEKYRQMVAPLANEAAEYASTCAEDPSEAHIVVLNVNPDFDWEYKPQYDLKVTHGKSIHIWGF